MGYPRGASDEQLFTELFVSNQWEFVDSGGKTLCVTQSLNHALVLIRDCDDGELWLRELKRQTDGLIVSLEQMIRLNKLIVETDGSDAASSTRQPPYRKVG